MTSIHRTLLAIALGLPGAHAMAQDPAAPPVQAAAVPAPVAHGAPHAGTAAQAPASPSPNQQGVAVADAWVRATVPGQKATGAFMTLRAASDTRLVSARSPAAAKAEVHEMKMDGDIMRMRQISALALPAGQSVALSPGGYHIMLLDLAQQVKAGDSIPLTLLFSRPDGQTESVEVTAVARPLNAGGASHGHGPTAPAGPAAAPHSH